MKRMVDNKKVEELEAKAENIGANQYIVSTNGSKNYYTRITITHQDDTFSNLQYEGYEYRLNKHIEENIVCDSLEDFIEMANEYCNDGISLNNYSYYDNDGVGISTYGIEDNSLYLRRNDVSKSIYAQDSPDMAMWTITDMTTGKYITLDI